MLDCVTVVAEINLIDVSLCTCRLRPLHVMLLFLCVCAAGSLSLMHLWNAVFCTLLHVGCQQC